MYTRLQATPSSRPCCMSRSRFQGEWLAEAACKVSDIRLDPVSKSQYRAKAKMSAEESEMMAALGFASFGHSQRQRKRARRSPPRASPLPQLMPGTEMPDSLLSTRCVRGPHGVLYLVKDTEDGEALRQAVMPQDDDHDSCSIGGQVQQHVLLERLADAKKLFDGLSGEQFLAARSACNPYERLGRHQFINRSAMKLATLDHVFEWTATAKVSSSDFAFADICGGPGGFSEYLLWQFQRHQGGKSENEEATKSSYIEGFGISLRDAANSCDWRLPPGLARVSVDEGSEDSAVKNADTNFTICYGTDGTGDLYCIDNIRRFRDVVCARCPRRVILVVADGGFLDARDQDNQESMMTRLVIAEVLSMLYVLRPGGDFVCKTFEVSTPVMRELVWLLHQCFDKLTIVKPITSRPASSERYIVARQLHSNVPLEAITELLAAFIVADTPNATLLPNPQYFSTDNAFHQFIGTANDLFAAAQINACEDIMEYAEASEQRKAVIKSEKQRGAKPGKYYACWGL